ncbi:LTA synthase family protein [Bacillus taeanensis]|uniref:LTA synthase family protein n=1 Tax=Bacillus taeanensis TaxID=273032 RepID=A0A366XPX2_9BACI|nr:LTA synthase family protein [Bacillus taeanensis]RBW68162.1 LTA synthase family protein [Bacillus taeanensis]
MKVKRKQTSFRLYGWTVILLWLKTYLVYKLFIGFSRDTLLGELILFISPISSVLLLIGFSFFFSKKIHAKWILVMNIIGTAILYINVLYYRFYIDFVTLPILFQFKNVGGLGPSTLELIYSADTLLFIDIAVIWWLIRKERPQAERITERKKHLIALVALLLFAAHLGLVKLNNPEVFKVNYDRKTIVANFGIFHYHMYDLYRQSLLSTDHVFATDKDVKEASDYTAQKYVSPHPTYFGAAKGKNVILISLESTQSFVINKKVNGEEVTPFLNELMNESYYFNNFYHQTAQGKTSDSEFLIDNSLYPLSSGSAFVRKTENEYNALPAILKGSGYYSAAFHGNDKTFWNRDVMYETLGYDRYFSKEDYQVTEENSVNYGLKDIPFFEQSLQHLDEIPQPFYAKFLTLTNHFPFLLDQKDEMITELETEEGVVNRYFTTVRYEDEAVRRFIEGLKKKGLYENSIIIMYGDHYGISNSYTEALEEALGESFTAVDQIELQRVPLFIHIPGEQGKVFHTTAGQIDLKPTILHLLGIDTKGTVQFGQDLFSKNREQLVIFRDGEFVTEELVYTEGVCYDKSSQTKLPYGNCKETVEIAQKELQLSDQIVHGDLLRFLK